MSVVQDGPREILVAALSSAFACGFAKILIHPLETGKMLLAHKLTDEGVDDVSKQPWKAGFNSGFLAKLCQSMATKFIYSFLFESLRRGTMSLENCLRRSLGWREKAKTSLAALLVSGYLSEALGFSLVAPLEYVAAQMRISKTREGPLAVARRTVRKAGAQRVYSEWRIYLLCAFQPMILYPVNQRMRTFMLAGKGNSAVLSAYAVFWIGILSKAIAATATYPIRNFRVIMQRTPRKKCIALKQLSAIADSKDKPGQEPSNPDCDDSLLGVIASVLREEGLPCFYKGLSRELAEGLILSTAPTLLVKDKATSVARAAVYATTEFRSEHFSLRFADRS